MHLTDVARFLGKPYFQADKCLIYNIDCLEAMRYLPGEFINLTVTSPPYNIGKEYEKPLQLDEYLKWCEKWIAEVYRITLSNGSLWLNLGISQSQTVQKLYRFPICFGTEFLFILSKKLFGTTGLV